MNCDRALMPLAYLLAAADGWNVAKYKDSDPVRELVSRGLLDQELNATPNGKSVARIVAEVGRREMTRFSDGESK